MKHSTMTAGSLATVFSPLAGIAALLAGTLPAQGVEVPFTERVISSTADRARSVFATDLDGDGDIDVLSASENDDKIAWYENDGCSPPTFTKRVISTTDGPFSVFATDVDGDGDIDVLSASNNDDKIAWYENDGCSPPSFTERVITEDPDGPGPLQGFANGALSVFATDVDGDGDTDVLSASIRNSKIAWYENDGGSPPTFTEHMISTAARLAFSVFATDVDGDGDTDVLSASFGNAKIAWYESDGGSPPSFTERVISTTANSATSVFATDVDGDGDTDILSASLGNDKIAWYENTPDSDGDGVPDGQDACPGTPPGEAVDLNGCSDSQVDSDGDGFCDPDAPSNGPSVCTGTDNCPNSDLSVTIVIDGIDTGVNNELLEDGCTLADLIDAIVAADPASVDVVQFLVDLKAEGFITGQDLGAILKALNSP